MGLLSKDELKEPIGGALSSMDDFAHDAYYMHYLIVFVVSIILYLFCFFYLKVHHNFVLKKKKNVHHNF